MKYHNLNLNLPPLFVEPCWDCVVITFYLGDQMFKIHTAAHISWSLYLFSFDSLFEVMPMAWKEISSCILSFQFCDKYLCFIVWNTSILQLPCQTQKGGNAKTKLSR